MPPHTYKSEYPPGSQIDQGIKTFFEDFYRTSDTPTPDAHEKYAAAFTKDAELIMISKVARGYDEILEVRKGMWTAVHSRLHTPVKMYPFGSGADEVMLYGTVGYVLKDGRKTDVS
ncbi:hypothetical protein LSUB1_G008919 [Lachnellula subtilissima]|uniref:SnoaL-like domain-containing protein n=1 Tax=Lachnellula subtilissima TaxID=602034 RepID=A0A8H8RC95_9HELO|nr:hypothetical protein LSUB1_G008919 [Lachnellula subtilissima]